MKPHHLAPRQWALAGALALSLAATAWVSGNDEPAEQVATAPRRAPLAAVYAIEPASATGAHGTRNARGDWPTLDPLAQAAWGDAAPATVAATPPPAAAAPDEPPPPPSAPPFPYQLVGRLTDGASRAVLNNAQRSAVVGAGEVVDGAWRVDAVEPGGLRLTYLPLGQAQFVPFASPPA
ncbi:hypothetical protein [Pelomonas cellulosilytica]|uniref:Type II secretion system protein GspC N-terminal domain-containing protein n=1 Tax=Pelomonas cellulosilytica TaxID=2906762 RepID=A0ABS8XWC0_9BURK|nr:hypothetical protein [Pelomonas sp. P8]MCE4556954.1 hypothetical protein [Pelomonas sp. P8]